MSRRLADTPVARFGAAPLDPPGAVRATWLQQALAAEARVDRDPPSADTTADVCIVGGGYLGLWTALELKRRSPACDVVVVEGDVCGGGASGRNGGFAMTWWSKFLTLQKHCGTEIALELARRSERAVADIGDFCAEHGIDADFRTGGWLWTATNREQVDAWRATVSALDAAGVHPFVALSRAEVAERSGSPVHLAGVHEPSVATVQPAVLARGLARVAAARGVRIHERTPMRALHGGAQPRVVTPTATITAGHVVVATNAWAAQIRQIAGAMVVVASDVIATAPIPDRLDRLGWASDLAVSDSRRLINYYRQSADGRVVFGKGGGTLAIGGRIGAGFHRASSRAEEVHSQFRHIYPMLWDVPLEAAWRGPVDYSITGLPFACRLEGERGILVGAGFSGNGVGPARVMGDVLAEMVLSGGDAGLPPVLTSVPTGKLPPEPLRHVGGLVVRAAVDRKEMREDAGRPVGRLTHLLAGLDPTSFVDRGAATPAPAAPAAVVTGGGDGNGAGKAPHRRSTVAPRR